MAQLQHNLSIAAKVSGQELFCRFEGAKIHCLNLTNQRRRFQNRGIIHCCSYSTSADQQLSYGTTQDKKVQFGYLISDEKWKVRRMIETDAEMREVAYVQAEAFHQPMPLFDDMFFGSFKAEVLSGLLYRLRNSAPDRYACLVAEPRNDTQELENELAGVVDVTVQREKDVLQHLPGAEEYLYVSGIAVLNKFRRKKVATTLLKACEILSTIWGFKYLVLRAYEDDHGARKLYSNAGYRVVSGDISWMSNLIGRRRSVLMVKEITPSLP